MELRWRDGGLPIKPQRLSNVLRVVTEESGYGKAMLADNGLRLACHRSFRSYVVFAVHVVARDVGSPHIAQADMAIDCCRYVNPDGVRKRMEGAVIYDHTVATRGRITTTQGAVDQSNLHDYTITHMDDARLDVRVHIVEDFIHLRPYGMGEPSAPPYTPALVDAVIGSIVKHISRLPIGDQLMTA